MMTIDIDNVDLDYFYTPVAVRCVSCHNDYLGGTGDSWDPLLSTFYNDKPFPHFICGMCRHEKDIE
jgi:hypothetical protein